MRLASERLWSRSLPCVSARNLAFSSSADLFLPLVANLVEGGRDDFFLALGDVIFFLFASTASAAHLLRLLIFALERLRFKEHDVGHGLRPRVPCAGMQARPRRREPA